MTADTRVAGPSPSSFVRGCGAVATWLRNGFVALWLPAAILLAWYWFSRGSDNVFFPPLTRILTTFREDFLSSAIVVNLVPSLLYLLLGLVLAIVAGVVVGYFVGLTTMARTMLMPVLDIFRSTPVVALIPVFIALFGIGRISEVLLIAWSGFWPILFATTAGVAGVDTGFRDTATALRMNRRQKLFLMRLPAAAPQAFAGINLGISMSVTAMVALELYSSSPGLGYYLSIGQIQFNIPAVYAGAITSGIVGFGAATIFYVLERRVFMSWYHKRGARAK